MLTFQNTILLLRRASGRHYLGLLRFKPSIPKHIHDHHNLPDHIETTTTLLDYEFENIEKITAQYLEFVGSLDEDISYLPLSDCLTPLPKLIKQWEEEPLCVRSFVSNQFTGEHIVQLSRCAITDFCKNHSLEHYPCMGYGDSTNFIQSDFFTT